MIRKIAMNGKQVKIWLLEKCLRQRDLIKEAGVKEPVLSQFINGKKTSRPLMRFFIEKGCPEEYFENGRVKSA